MNLPVSTKSGAAQVPVAYEQCLLRSVVHLYRLNSSVLSENCGCDSSRSPALAAVRHHQFRRTIPCWIEHAHHHSQNRKLVFTRAPSCCTVRCDGVASPSGCVSRNRAGVMLMESLIGQEVHHSHTKPSSIVLAITG